MWTRAILLSIFLVHGVTGWKFGDMGIEDFTCGDQSCYAVLYVTNTASSAEIKRSYRRLALDMHPDKSEEPDAPKRFAMLAKAYEILSDPNRREAHNAYLQHPARFTALYYGYQTIVPAKTNPWFVVGLILFVLQLGQYFNARWRYDQTIGTIRQDPAFKKAVNNKIRQECGNKFRKMPVSEQEEVQRNIEEKVLNELVVYDGSKPKPFQYTDLILYKLLLWPLDGWKWVAFNVRWFLRFTVGQEPYTAADHAYLTRKALKLSEEKWEALEERERKHNLDLELWIPKNYEVYKNNEIERARESKCRQRKLSRKKGGHDMFGDVE